MFLTDLDPRAAVKGSRDPLGLVPLWSHFGRQVVGNLTTVTNSVRGFTTLLLGYHFAHEVRDLQGREAESTLALFLKFEQLAAYCRHFVKTDAGFRGIERVKKNLAESSSVRLSASSDSQILSNQKVYGLWGLFSSPSRVSGLLERTEPVLTPETQAFVGTTYLGALSAAGFPNGRAIVDLLKQRRPVVHLDGKHAELAQVLARLLSRRPVAGEREFYRESLLYGGPDDTTQDRQRQLAELMDDMLEFPGFDRGQLRECTKAARRRGDTWEPLAERLRRIDVMESLLVPTAGAFALLQARHGQKLADVAEELRKTWGKRLRFVDAGAVAALKAEIGAALRDEITAETWVRLAEALSAGDYEAALSRLLEQNGRVMQSRNGSDPWIRIDRKRLDVRFKDETTRMPAKEDLPDAWRNTYFLDSLKAIGSQLREA